MDDNLIRTRRDNALMLYGIIFAFIFILLCSFILSPMAVGLPKLFYSRLITWADILILYLYASKIERQKFLLWIETWHDPFFYIKWIFLLFLLIICCGIIARIPSLFGIHDNETIARKVMAVVKSNKLSFVFTLITAGVTEELIFRGYILPRLELLTKNPYTAVIITSLLFAGLHFGYHSISELIFTFCFAIVCGAHYQLYKSISTLIVFHILVDLIALSVHHPK